MKLLWTICLESKALFTRIEKIQSQIQAIRWACAEASKRLYGTHECGGECLGYPKVPRTFTHHTKVIFGKHRLGPRSTVVNCVNPRSVLPGLSTSSDQPLQPLFVIEYYSYYFIANRRSCLNCWFQSHMPAVKIYSPILQPRLLDRGRSTMTLL